jgi:hypothetical protein
MRALSSTAAAVLLAFSIATVASAAQHTGNPPASGPGAAPADSSDTASPQTLSKVRIVRLSEVRGDVQLDRGTGQGFEAATPNMPIVESSRIRTGTGVAEIEFEDNSTLRVAADSLVEFPRLELLPSGATVSTVRIVKGMAYASLAPTKGNEFTLAFGQRTLQLPPSSHVRLEMDASQAKLAVLDGKTSVDEASGPAEIGKNRTLTFDLANQNPPAVAKKVVETPFDNWDHTSAQYHQRFTGMSSFGATPYSYGISDMLYYGSFASAGACGSMWRPYFAGAAWSPFDNGIWAWYPGAGYSWVSPYPWGWTPFHSGAWEYCNGTGWGWQPNGSWNSLGNQPVTNRLHQTIGHLPEPPRHAPIAGQSTLVAVSRSPLIRSTLGAQNSFVFRNDSAGLGVPRGDLGKLNHLSGSVERHGSATTAVFIQAPGSNASEARASGYTAAHGGQIASTMHAGTPAESSGFASRSAAPSAPAFSAPSYSAPSAPMAAPSSGGGHPR